MTCHKQIATEIDMHSEVLLALRQRLDLGLHRVGQRGTRDDALGIRRAGERVPTRQAVSGPRSAAETNG